MVVILSDAFICLAFGEAFAASGTILATLSLGIVFLGLNQVFTHLLIATNNQRILLKIRAVVCVGFLGLADIALEWNALDAAEAHVDRGIGLCRQGGIGHNLIPAYCTKAILSQALGDAEGALEALHSALEIHRPSGSLLMAVHLVWQGSRLWLSRGDVETAARWMQGTAGAPLVPAAGLPVVLYEVYQVSRARVCLAQGELRKVLAICDQVYDTARAAGRMARVLEVSLLKALALQAQGQPDAALAPLAQCLSLAEPEGYVRLFIEAGQGMPALLLLALERDTCPTYARTLLAAMGLPQPPQPSHPAQPLAEPLTEREREVLRLIGDGYRNQAIAEELVVTLNTVKKHTSNIYGKLGVRSRTQAIVRARELGLL